MTLVPYDPDRLDRLALRTLDLAARVRKMARSCREEQLPAVDLHDRKALEWLANLEEWAIGAEAALYQCVERAKGERAARRVIGKGRRK